MLRGNSQQSLFFIDQSFVNHIYCDFNRSTASTFTAPGLQNIEAAFLDREFNILHVPIVLLEHGLGFIEFLINLWALYLKVFNGLWGSNPCNHILSGCIKQVFAEETVFSRRRIASKRNARA